VKLGFLLLTLLLFLVGCANFDNTNLQSAKPLPAGERRLSWHVAQTVNYIPLVSAQSDSDTTIVESEDASIGIANRPKLTIGLGYGMELSGTLGVYLGSEYSAVSPGGPSFSLAPAAMLKLQVKKSFLLDDRYYLAVAPTYTLNNGVYKSNHTARKFSITGWEIPVIYTKVIPNAEGNHSHSFTIRYAQAELKSELKASTSELFMQIIYEQPNHTMYRSAFIYTFGYEKAKKRRYFDAGLEFIWVSGTDSVALIPIFGMSWDIGGMKALPWK
jgi:hypothetical protein